MGTRREEFVILGANIPKDKFEDSFYDDYKQYFTKKIGETVYLYDGMNGEYFIVGEILARGDEYDGFQKTLFINLKDSKIETLKNKIQNLIKENFKIDVEPQIIVLTHWS